MAPPPLPAMVRAHAERHILNGADLRTRCRQSTKRAKKRKAVILPTMFKNRILVRLSVGTLGHATWPRYKNLPTSRPSSSHMFRSPSEQARRNAKEASVSSSSPVQSSQQNRHSSHSLIFPSPSNHSRDLQASQLCLFSRSQSTQAGLAQIQSFSTTPSIRIIC